MCDISTEIGLKEAQHESNILRNGRKSAEFFENVRWDFMDSSDWSAMESCLPLSLPMANAEGDR